MDVRNSYIVRLGVLRVRSSFRFLSWRSPIGTARHLFSRSVSGASGTVFSASCGISTGSTTSVGIVMILSMTVLLSCLARSSSSFPWATLTARPKRGSWRVPVIRFSSFVGSSSNESLWKETVQRFSFSLCKLIFFMDNLIAVSRGQRPRRGIIFDTGGSVYRENKSMMGDIVWLGCWFQRWNRVTR